MNPKHKNKFLIKGKLDLDRQDFALTRVSAEPAINPSWWTVRNEIEQTYAARAVRTTKPNSNGSSSCKRRSRAKTRYWRN